MRLGLGVLGLVSALLVNAPAFAQGRLTGTVKDAGDHPIKGATITAENPNAAPSSFVGATDAKGRFAFLGLRGGEWVITAEAPGFQPSRVHLTTHTMGTNPSVQLTLEPLPAVAPLGPMATIDVAAVQRQLDDAAALEASGQLDTAIDRYREILSRLPALTSVHLQLGLLYERKHDTAAATAEYQAILKGEPGNPKARAALDRLARQ
jgi:hypothetical protein